MLEEVKSNFNHLIIKQDQDTFSQTYQGGKKGRGLKSMKLEMKKKLQQTLHKYKGSLDYYNNYTPPKWKT